MNQVQNYKWINLISISILHLIALYSLFRLPFVISLKSLIFLFITGSLAGFGVTAGVHRLWCHKSYSATTSLRVFLAFCYSISGQNSIFDWVRDHRIHHLYSETNADPHNSKRGLLFSHVGWLTMNKHPEVIEKGKLVNMNDILEDKVSYYHTKFFWFFKILFCFVLPYYIPYYFWNESHSVNFMALILRYTLTLNFTWSVNSFAHIFGNKPYNKNIMPSENKFVAFFALGEGFHNYHHVFPWDYKTSELGFTLNVTTMWINLFYKLGLASNLKTVKNDVIDSMKTKYGDHSSF